MQKAVFATKVGVRPRFQCSITCSQLDMLVTLARGHTACGCLRVLKELVQEGCSRDVLTTGRVTCLETCCTCLDLFGDLLLVHASVHGEGRQCVYSEVGRKARRKESLTQAGARRGDLMAQHRTAKCTTSSLARSPAGAYTNTDTNTLPTLCILVLTSGRGPCACAYAGMHVCVCVCVCACTHVCLMCVNHARAGVCESGQRATPEKVYRPPGGHGIG